MYVCLLKSSARVIGGARGAIWLNPFATVLFSVCSAVTVVLDFDACCMGAFAVIVRNGLLSSVCNNGE